MSPDAQATLREYPEVRQIPGERRRRWFYSAEFDLVVWLDDDGTPAGFELCYDKATRQRALRWHRQGGFQAMAVDDGEHRPGKYKATPVLVPDAAPVDAGRVRAAFERARGEVPPTLADFVLGCLARYPASGEATRP